ncbi:MAG: hypothetical protein KBG16_02530 [Methanospirillum sp.]|jgi:hypothetical protein|nr:hypothetical protein [Methanospirillum sp.]
MLEWYPELLTLIQDGQYTNPERVRELIEGEGTEILYDQDQRDTRSIP